MHHVVLEQWSRGNSPLHRRDPRAKIVALLAFLIAVATAQHASAATALLWLAVLSAATVSARLPLGSTMLRAAVVLPFSLIFGLITWMAGDSARAFALVARSYVSALAVLLVVATTRLPELLRGLELMGVPRFLLMVAQFLYRYLFVLSEEAQHMSTAAKSRGGRSSAGIRPRFRAAAGALGVLFARSYARAEEIHRAMLARGFAGQFRAASPPHFGWMDGVFTTGAVLAAVAVRVLGEAARS